MPACLPVTTGRITGAKQGINTTVLSDSMQGMIFFMAGI